MPQTVEYTTAGTFSYTIPEAVASIRITLYGGGGGGEFVNSTSFLATAGGNGGDTSFIGLVAGGGRGGGIGSKNTGGAGGTTSTTYNWSNLGVTVSSQNGSAGSISTGGAGGFFTGQSDKAKKGGDGTPGASNYFSSVYHEFNNDTDTHIITSSSSDISVSYNSPGAADGLPCGTNSSYKHYGITFLQPYSSSNYSIDIYGLCSQAAAGGSGNMTVAGTANKTASGFSVWFCRDGANSYIRCFNIFTSGLKAGAAGIGGGGSSSIRATITREQLINSNTYRPGTSHTLTVGTGGSAGGSSATAGLSGYAEFYLIIQPRVTLSSNKVSIIRGQSAKLTWLTTGDADTISFTPVGAVSNKNLTSEETVSPTTTTTYTATATGLGGTGTSNPVTIIVYQPPTATISAPNSLNYGSQGTVQYSVTYANVNVKCTPYYKYDNQGWVAGTVITLEKSASAEEGAGNITKTGSFETQIPYNDYGPRQVQYVLEATGDGGVATVDDFVDINIDETPDNVIIPDTDDAFKDQDPVYTPNIEVTTDVIEINDVDIPVEIKSNKPIKVKINDGNWTNIRQL